MDKQNTNDNQKSRETSIWKKYFSGWNFVGVYLSRRLIKGKNKQKENVKEESQTALSVHNGNKEQKQKNKKRIWLVILLISVGFFVVIFIFNSNNSDDFSEKDIKLPKIEKNISNYEQIGNLYKNTKYGFRIIFPENWEQKEGNGPNILRKAVNGNHSINIGVREFPKELEGEKFNIKDIFSLEEYKQTTFEGIKEKFSNAKIINYGETQIDNQPAYWISYETPYSVLGISVNGIMIQYQVIYNNTFYFITIGSAKDEFGSIEGILKKSVSTFVFENY